MKKVLIMLLAAVCAVCFSACKEEEPVYNMQKKRLAGIWTVYPAQADVVTSGLLLSMDHESYEFTHLNGTIQSQKDITTWNYDGEHLTWKTKSASHSEPAWFFGGLLYIGDKIYEPGHTEYSLTERERPLVGRWKAGDRTLLLNGDGTGLDGTTPITWGELSYDVVNARWRIQIVYPTDVSASFFVTGPTDSFTIDGVTFTRA